MSIIARGLVFSGLTVSNAVLFVFHSRVVLRIVAIAESFGTGPASPAINLLPQALMLAMLIIEVIAVSYLLGAFSQQRKATQGPV